MILKKSFSILLLSIAIFFIWSFSIQNEKTQDLDKKVKVALRDVGNKLLLLNKDSTSLVLPILKTNKNTFSLSFEKELSFEPSNLVTFIKNSLDKASYSKNYRVEVIQCKDKEVAYSYEINKLAEKTIIPCAGRYLPKSCYAIEVQFLDNKTYGFGNVLFYLGGLLLALIFVFFNFYKKKPEELKEENTNNITLGSFKFYPEQNKLVKQATEISLSKKECELLAIFVAKPNQIVKREELEKRVWEDNGVIVGRSLDTYISKLRKKLKEDATIKLTNVHGVGYKLEV